MTLAELLKVLDSEGFVVQYYQVDYARRTGRIKPVRKNVSGMCEYDLIHLFELREYLGKRRAIRNRRNPPEVAHAHSDAT